MPGVCAPAAHVTLTTKAHAWCAFGAVLVLVLVAGGGGGDRGGGGGGGGSVGGGAGGCSSGTQRHADAVHKS